MCEVECSLHGWLCVNQERYMGLECKGIGNLKNICDEPMMYESYDNVMKQLYVCYWIDVDVVSD